MKLHTNSGSNLDNSDLKNKQNNAFQDAHVYIPGKELF